MSVLGSGMLASFSCHDEHDIKRDILECASASEHC